MNNVVNTNTIVVPLTVVLSVAIGTWLISNNVNDKFNRLSNSEREQAFKQEKLEARVKTMEDLKVTDRWTSVEMFKWAVHLQKANPTIKVPEPDGNHGE